MNRGYAGVGHSVASESIQPFSFNANTRHEGPGFSGRLEPSAGSNYQGNLSLMLPGVGYPGTYTSYSNPGLGEDGGYPRTYSSDSNPVSGNNLTQYGSYMHNPQRTHEATYSHGTFGYGNSAEEAISAYRPPYVSPHGIPLLRPQGCYPADVQHPGTASYHPPRYN